MPRPVLEHKTVVAPVQVAQEQAPQLGVYAPMDVRAPTSGGFAGLAQALGVLGPAVGGALKQRADATAKADAAEGQADAELAQVDPERAASSRAYADAAHNTNIVKQYQDAEAAVTEWAATNLDASKPFTEQTAALDAEMKRRLGGLAQDPRAKAIIAPRYQKFIEGAANGILSKQVEARANEALDTAKGDIAADLAAGGDGRYAEQVQRLAPLLGDRTKAVQAVVGMYIDHAQDVAAKGGDWQAVFNSLPSDITLPDGTKIPGPGRSPALHDAIARGKDAAQRAYNAYAEPMLAQQRLHVMTQLDNLARHGGLITEAMMKPYIMPGPNGEPPILTEGQAAGYVNQARDTAERLANEAANRQTLRLNPDWMTLVGQKDPSDPKGKRVFTQAGFQTAYDQTLSMATQGFTAPDTVQKAIALTKQNPGLISTTLKLQFAAAAADTSGVEAVKMLPAFLELQRAKQDGQYLDDKALSYFTYLSTKVDVNAPDAKNIASVSQAAENYDPERYARLTSAANVKAARDEVVKSVGGHWYSFLPGAEGATKLTDFANWGQVNIDIDNQLKTALIQTGGNTQAAAATVSKIISDKRVPVEVQGIRLLIPDKYGLGADRIQANMTAISNELIPQLAKQAGLTEEQAKDKLGFQVYMGARGVSMVQVVDDMGQTIDSIPANTLDWYLQQGDIIRRKNEDRRRREVGATSRANSHITDRTAGTPLYMQH